MFHEFVLWVVVGSIIIFALKFKELDDKIRKFEMMLPSLDKFQKKVIQLEVNVNDIVNSLSEEEYNTLGLLAYSRDLEDIYHQINKMMKGCGADTLLHNQLFESRENVATKIRNTKNEIQEIRRKGNKK